MFRIGFDSATGSFVVQVRCFLLGLIPHWNTVCQQCDGPAGATPVLCERQFETYQQARVWVDKIGLQEALAESKTDWWSQHDLPSSSEAQ